jgi:hypothetical protein
MVSMGIEVPLILIFFKPDFNDDISLANSPIFLLYFRYVFAVLGSMGMAIIYGLKVNLSIALGTENPKLHTGKISNKILISGGGFYESLCTKM